MTEQTLTESPHARFDTISRQIEALLFASEKPLTASDLRNIYRCLKELDTALIVLESRLHAGVLTLAHTATGYRLQVQNQYSSLIQQVFTQQMERLSQALLETLSVIAYKQPVTRGDIEQVRGVTVSATFYGNCSIRVGLSKRAIVTRSVALLYCTPRPNFCRHSVWQVWKNCPRCPRLEVI